MRPSEGSSPRDAAGQRRPVTATPLRPSLFHKLFLLRSDMLVRFVLMLLVAASTSQAAHKHARIPGGRRRHHHRGEDALRDLQNTTTHNTTSLMHGLYAAVNRSYPGHWITLVVVAVVVVVVVVVVIVWMKCTSTRASGHENSPFTEKKNSPSRQLSSPSSPSHSSSHIPSSARNPRSEAVPICTYLTPRSPASPRLPHAAYSPRHSLQDPFDIRGAPHSNKQKDLR